MPSPSLSHETHAVSAPVALRQTLIAAAVEILAEPGTGLDLRKVAERAGKSRTAPYLVFGKERDGGGLRGLRMAVAAEGLRMLLVELSEQALPGSDPLLGLQNVVHSIYRFSADRPRLFDLMYADENLEGPNPFLDGRAENPEAERLLTLRRDVEEVLAQHIRELRQCGLLGLSESCATKALAGHVVGHATMSTLDRNWDDDSRLEASHVAVAAIVGFSPGALELTARTFLETRGVWNPSDGVGAGAAAQLSGTADLRSDEGRVARLLRGLRRVGPEASGEPAELSANRVPRMNSADLTQVVTHFSGLRRATRGRGEIEGKPVVWVSQEPENSAPEVSTLRSLGLSVVIALSGGTLEIPDSPDGSRPPALIVVDTKSGGRQVDQDRAVAQAGEVAGPKVAVVLYGSNGSDLRSHPPGIAGIAPQMNELLHLLMDVIGGR